MTKSVSVNKSVSLTKSVSGRRGYKICKNLECQSYLHINQHICKKCMHNNVSPSKTKDSQQIEKKI